MKYPHLLSALLALGIFIIGITSAVAYASHLESEYVYEYSNRKENLKLVGSALSRAAIIKNDILPIIGASEVLMKFSQYQSGFFFRRFPTGFQVFEMARPGASFLSAAQIVAGLGSTLKDRKIVLSFLPSAFEINQVPTFDYGRMYSRLHANQFIFGLNFKMRTKRVAAERMLRYSRFMKDDPLLLFALQKLDKISKKNTALYAAVLPLGWLHTLALKIQDHLVTLGMFFKNKPKNPSHAHHPFNADWDALAAKALEEEKHTATNNPYGFENPFWSKRYEGKFVATAHPGSNDRSYIEHMSRSAEWHDLDILLRVLKDVGAKPLFLGRPMKKDFYEALGISGIARRFFYRRFSEKVKQFGGAVVDFREYEDHSNFTMDQLGHTSREGWVYVNRVLDAYYHDQLEQ